MAKSNAQRQREYRDRKRGGPPKGRWHGHTSVGEIAAQYGGSRTRTFMSMLVKQWRPDLFKQMQAGTIKTGTAYKAAIRERDMAIARALD